MDLEEDYNNSEALWPRCFIVLARGECRWLIKKRKVKIISQRGVSLANQKERSEMY